MNSEVMVVELPTTQASKLISSLSLKWIDQMVIGEMPRELAGNKDKTICQVTEWLNEPQYYANRTFKGWTIGVVVHIFYKANSKVNSLNNEIKLAKAFVKDNWTIEQSKNHTQDPDTRQVTKVFYFAKDLILKESEK